MFKTEDGNIQNQNLQKTSELTLLLKVIYQNVF